MRKIGEFLNKVKEWETTTSTRDKILLIVISILIPLFLFYKFFYLPKKKQINRLNQDIKKLELKITKYRRIASQEFILKERLKKRQEFLEKIKTILPTDKEIPGLLKNIAYLAKKSGLEIISFKPGKEIPRNYYNIIPVNLESKGKYINIFKFLNGIATMPRLVVLENIDFQLQKKTSDIKISALFHTFKYTGEVSKKPKKKGKRR